MTVPTFPTLKLAWPVIRTPIWDTKVQVSVAGKRTAYSLRAFPVYAYELTHNVLRADAHIEWQTLFAFYNSVFGRANLFIYNDPSDGTATVASFGTGDGTTVAFQLTRPITGTGVSWVDPIFCPTGTPQISVNGVLKSTPADYSISATGLVTFTSPPGNGLPLTWTGTFGWFCRFSDDSYPFENFMYQFWRLGKIKFDTELF